MAMKRREVSHAFSVELYRTARADIAALTLQQVLDELPNAVIVEIRAFEFYDDSKPIEPRPRVHYDEWDGCYNARTSEEELADLKHVNAQLREKLQRHGLWDDPE